MVENNENEKTNAPNKNEFSFTGTPMGRNTQGERRAKRHDGRSLKSSICDLIDNSIDAQASEVRILYARADYRGYKKGALMIEDNGKGIAAMKMMDSLSFNNHRVGGYETWELGSFGVGLDDSCLAHGQEITVFSKEKNKDFNMVRLSCELTDMAMNDWILVDHGDLIKNLPIAWDTDPFRACLDRIKIMNTGTIVLLEDMDALNEEIDENNQLGPIEEIKDFIALTFCDYLEGIDLGPRSKDEKLKIYFNDSENISIKPLDPFFRSEYGVGYLNGQNGTYMSPYEFNLDGMNFVINRYITPNINERKKRCPSIDRRIVSAVGNNINNAQGIYYKRNGRILDGPWNGNNWRRTQGMAMGTSHHSVSRWEFILPSESIDNPNMVPPDKMSVRSDMFQKEILKAKDEKIEWHEEDKDPYGTGKWSKFGWNGKSSYSTRSRSHNDGDDIPTFCLEEDCSLRINHNKQFCKIHELKRCGRCNEILTEDDETICEICVEMICKTNDCENFIENKEDEHCITCQQPICSAENCELKSIIQTEYCSHHEKLICMQSGCRELSEEKFNKCNTHLTIFKAGHGVRVKLVRSGKNEDPVTIEGNNILLNIDTNDISMIIANIKNENLGS